MTNVADFDFDQWKDLAEHNPQQFEIQRRIYLQHLIETSNNPQNLAELQAWIDILRCQATSPLAACEQLSALMWRSYMLIPEPFYKLVKAKRL